MIGKFIWNGKKSLWRRRKEGLPPPGWARHQLQNSPTRFSCFASCFPQPTTTKKCIAVVAFLHAARQSLHLFHVAATEDNIIGDERKFQLLDTVKHFLAPRFFAKPLKPVYAEPVFNFAMFAVGQITELERQKVAIPNKGRAETGAQPKKKHMAPNVTPQRLHGGVVNDPSGLFERATKIEPDPTFAEMFRFLDDLAVAHN